MLEGNSKLPSNYTQTANATYFHFNSISNDVPSTFLLPTSIKVFDHSLLPTPIHSTKAKVQASMLI